MDSNYSLSDVAAVTRGNDGFGFGDGGFFWIFALLLLPMMWGGGFGGWGGRGCNGQPVTEAGLCNAMNFNNLENAVGRGFDQQSQFAFQNQRDLCTSTATLSNQMTNGFYGIQGQLADCCCTTNRNIDQLRYDGAMNTAAINANTTAQIQSVKDMLCAQENARKDSRIWQLELNQALCGIPRTTPYGYGIVPQFAQLGCCNGWGNGNI